LSQCGDTQGTGVLVQNAGGIRGGGGSLVWRVQKSRRRTREKGKRNLNEKKSDWAGRGWLPSDRSWRGAQGCFGSKKRREELECGNGGGGKLHLRRGGMLNWRSQKRKKNPPRTKKIREEQQQTGEGIRASSRGEGLAFKNKTTPAQASKMEGKKKEGLQGDIGGNKHFLSKAKGGVSTQKSIKKKLKKCTNSIRQREDGGGGPGGTNRGWSLGGKRGEWPAPEQWYNHQRRD